MSNKERNVRIGYTTGHECRSINDLQYSIELEWYQGTEIMENDCKQPLRIGKWMCGDTFWGRQTTRTLIIKAKSLKTAAYTDVCYAMSELISDQHALSRDLC